MAASRTGMQLVAVVVAALLVAAAAADVPDAFRNTDVSRKIDCKKHSVKAVTKVTLTSTQGTASKYVVAVEEDMAAHMAFIGATDSKRNRLTVKPETNYEKEGFALFTVRLPSGVKEDATAKITITQVFTHVQRPLPAEVLQGDPQLVVFEANHYFASPYETAKMKTTVKLASKRVESHSQLKPTSVSGESIEYGTYRNVEAYSVSPMRIHFENNSPFATIKWAEREIEISHWGSVSVEEHYELHHTGAQLKGGFSRLDYQMHMKQGASFRSLKSHIPYDATDLYYRDIIGNISTSHVRQGDDYQEMETEMRFPMFGGWRTQWYQGYNLPLSAVVSTEDDGSYKMTLPFEPTLQAVVVDELTVKVILPEGASNIQVDAPTDVSRSESVRFTYLDTPWGGRTVVSLKAANLVRQNGGDLVVTYSMPAFFLMREPLMLVAAFFVLFLTYSISSRINLSIKS